MTCGIHALCEASFKVFTDTHHHIPVAEKMQTFNDNLDNLFGQSRELELEIKKQLAGLKYE